MGIAFRKLIGSAGILGVWEITESTERLQHSLIPEEQEEFCVHQHISEKRKREWLATRCLLKALMPNPEKICYHPTGAPYLSGGAWSISISHSGDFVAVYLLPHCKIGVDIQQSKTSVIKGADFFVNDAEKKWLRHENIPDHNLIWSAKESVYKYLQHSDLDFKNDVQICPVPMEQFGHIEAYVFNVPEISKVSLQFEWIGEYILTWTTSSATSAV